MEKHGAINAEYQKQTSGDLTLAFLTIQEVFVGKSQVKSWNNFF